MSFIKKLDPEDIHDYINIPVNAYPWFLSPIEEDKNKQEQRLIELQKNDDAKNIYGLYRENKLLGGMVLHDFNVKILSTKIQLGGVGSVAVDFLHKKEKVCKELITYFLTHYRNRNIPMVALYAFRPDFYKKMGFGCGSKINEYKLKPEALPPAATKSNHLQFIGKDRLEDLVICHNHVADKTHGMIEKKSAMFMKYFDDPNYRIVGYDSGTGLLGYLIFTFKKRLDQHPLIYDMQVEEFVYENTEALLALLSFLNKQADQIRTITLYTHDDFFHHLLLDPRTNPPNVMPLLAHESNTQGIGIMYRVVNVQKLFELLLVHNFNHQTCKIKCSIQDSFLPSNTSSIVLHFLDGVLTLPQEHSFEVEIAMNVADFSSLIMGAVTFKSLYQYGLAKLSDQQYLHTITTIFRTDEKPVCLVRF
jgi:predicted acetyltransferase